VSSVKLVKADKIKAGDWVNWPEVSHSDSEFYSVKNVDIDMAAGTVSLRLSQLKRAILCRVGQEIRTLDASENEKSDELYGEYKYSPSPNNKNPLDFVIPGSLLSKEELRRIARYLFIELGMTRESGGDYGAAIHVLRGVYDAGRARGINESGSGCMG